MLQPSMLKNVGLFLWDFIQLRLLNKTRPLDSFLIFLLNKFPGHSPCTPKKLVSLEIYSDGFLFQEKSHKLSYDMVQFNGMFHVRGPSTFENMLYFALFLCSTKSRLTDNTKWHVHHVYYKDRLISLQSDLR